MNSYKQHKHTYLENLLLRRVREPLMQGVLHHLRHVPHAIAVVVDGLEGYVGDNIMIER